MMDGVQSWRNKLELLKRMPRPNKSRQTTPACELYFQKPGTASLDLRSAAKKSSNKKMALDLSYKAVKDVQRFMDSPTPDLPHRPKLKTQTLGKLNTNEKINLTDLRKKRARALYTSRTMNQFHTTDDPLFYRGHLITRHMLRLKLFKRQNNDVDEFRCIPECLDTTSEFYNPRVSADERFNKYLDEMKRVDVAESWNLHNKLEGNMKHSVKSASESKCSGLSTLPNIHSFKTQTSQFE